MVNKKIIKIIFTTILSITCLLLFHTISQAASFSASISKTTVTVGDTFNVTVTANNAAGMYSVTNSNSNVSLSSGSKSEFLENTSATLTFKAIKEGTVTITAKATDMTDLDDDSKTVTGSKTFTVTVKAKSTSTSSGGSNSGSSSGSGSTDTTTKPTFSSRNEKVYATSEVNVRSSYSTSSSVLGTLSEGDSVTRTGIATQSVNGILWSKVTYNGKTAYISSSYLTTTKPEEKDNKEDEEKSDNANLKTLEVTPTGLSPVFSNSTTEYTMTVGSDIDKIEVNAVAEDSKAKVSVSGNADLKIGTNTVKIKVTAENETAKTYTITVTKEEKEQLKLSELLIEGLPLEPEFDSNVYEYTLNLDKSNVSELNITATPNEKSAEVEIVGNTDLKAGVNVVTILVKSSDGEEITTYQITVNVPETVVQGPLVDKNLYKYVGIGIVVLALIIIIAVIIRKSKKNKEEEYATYYGAYETEKKENVNDADIENKQEEVNLEELPKLDEEDLPKSLRKDKIEEKENGKTSKEEKEEKSDRSKKIDELYSLNEDEVPKKRGKHF